MSYKYHLTTDEEVNLSQIQDLISDKVREDVTIDYKQQLPKDIARTVCAFLNTYGGQIVLGIAEENEVPTQIVGFDSEEISALNQRIKDKIRPPVDIRIETIDIPEEENKVILIIKIPRKKGTWYLSGGSFFIRQGDSTNQILSELDKEEWKRNHPENFPDEIKNFRDNYLKKLAYKYSKVHFYGFPIEVLAQIKPLSVSDIFVPLPLVLNKDYEISNKRDRFLSDISKKMFPVDYVSKTNMQQLSRDIYEFSDIELQFKFIGFLLRSFQKLVILGLPGSGKSTFMSFLCHYFSTKNEKLLDVNIDIIPFYIEAKEYIGFMEVRKKEGKQFSLLDYIVYDLKNRFSFSFDDIQLKNQVEEIISSNKALVLIDALDEIIDVSKQKEIVSLIQLFAVENNETRFIISSRTIDYNQYSFPDDEFIHAYIMSLKINSVNDFIGKWFRLTETDENLRKEKIAYLSAKIKENISLYHLASNPLILTLICLTLKVGTTLPSQQFELYTNLSKTLAVTREEVKELSSIIPYNYLEQILSEIAFTMLNIFDKAEKPSYINKKMLIKIITNFFEREFRDEKLKALDKAKKIVEEFIIRPIILIPTGDHFVFWHQTFLDYYATIYVRKLYLNRKEMLLDILQKKISKNHWWEIFHLVIESLDEISRQIANDYSKMLFENIEKLKPPNNYLLRRIAQKKSVNIELKENCKKLLITSLKSEEDNIWVTAIIELQALLSELDEENEMQIIQIIFQDIKKFQKIFNIQSRQIAPLNDFLNNLYTKDNAKFEMYLRTTLIENDLIVVSQIVEKFVADEIDFEIIDSIISLYKLELNDFKRFHTFRKLIKKPIKEIEKQRKVEERIINKILAELGTNDFSDLSIEELALTISFINRTLKKSFIPFEPGKVFLQIPQTQPVEDIVSEMGSKEIVSNELELNHLTWISDTILDFFENTHYERLDTKFNFVSNGKPVTTFGSFMPPVIITPETKKIDYVFNIHQGFYYDHPFSYRFRIKLNSYKSGFAHKYIFSDKNGLNSWMNLFEEFKQKSQNFGITIIEQEEVRLLERANKLFLAGDYEEVIKISEQMINMDPSFDPGYRIRARALGGANKFEESLKACEEHDSIFGKHKETELQKVANFVILFDFETALNLVNQIEDQYEYEKSSLLFLKEKKGIALYETDKKNTQKAIKIFNEIMKENPTNYRPYYHKAKALLKIGKYDECLKFLDRRKSDITYEFPLILIPRLLCYINLNRIDDAVELYFKIRDKEIEPNLIITPTDENEETPFLDKVLEIDPDDENSLIAKALIYKKIDLSKSYANIERVVNINPKNALAWFFKGEIELEMGNKDECISSMIIAAQIDPVVLKNIKGRLKLEEIESEIRDKCY